MKNIPFSDWIIIYTCLHMKMPKYIMYMYMYVSKYMYVPVLPENMELGFSMKMT